MCTEEAAAEKQHARLRLMEVSFDVKHQSRPQSALGLVFGLGGARVAGWGGGGQWPHYCLADIFLAQPKLLYPLPTLPAQPPPSQLQPYELLFFRSHCGAYASQHSATAAPGACVDSGSYYRDGLTPICYLLALWFFTCIPLSFI